MRTFCEETIIVATRREVILAMTHVHLTVVPKLLALNEASLNGHVRRKGERCTVATSRRTENEKTPLPFNE